MFKHDAGMLLGCILYKKSIRRKFVNLGTKKLFKDDLILGVFENSFQRWLSKDIACMPTVLVGGAQAHLENLPQAASRDEFMQYINLWKNRSQFTEEIGNVLFEQYGYQAVKLELATNVGASRTLTEARDSMTKALTSLNSFNAKSKPVIRNPFFEYEAMMQKTIPHLTGIRFIDKLTGGIVPGTHCGILGGTGGGKSTLANMLICNQAIMNHHCLLVQYEQKAEGNIANRMYSLMTNLPMDAFKNKASSELKPEQLEKIKHIRETTGRYFHIISFADTFDPGTGLPICGAGGASEVIDVIENMVDPITGEKVTPKFVLLDWLGAAIESQMARDHKDKEHFTSYAENYMNILNVYGRQHSISFFYLQQTDTTTQGKKAVSYRPTDKDSKNFHAFSQKLEHCWTLSALDPRKMCFLSVMKSRESDTGYVRMQLKGANATFEEQNDGRSLQEQSAEFVAGTGEAKDFMEEDSGASPMAGAYT